MVNSKEVEECLGWDKESDKKKTLQQLMRRDGIKRLKIGTKVFEIELK